LCCENIKLIALLVLSSCVYDPPHPKIATIKNATNTNIIVLYGGDSVSESRLFYTSAYTVDANSIFELYGPNPLIGKDNKIHFFFFKKDSVYKFIRLNTKKSIVASSFLKMYLISPDSLRLNDTITYK
jgi:hypothetical protein